MRTRTYLALLILAASLGSAGVAWASAGTLAIAPPWGDANLVTESGVDGLVLTYELKVGKNIPSAVVQGAHDAIAAWNSALDKPTWFIVLREHGSGTASRLLKKPANPGGGKGKGGKNGGDAPDVTIQLKKGGGRIAGSAQRTFDANGFVTNVKIQVAAASFGLGNSAAQVFEVLAHELGHAFALGHHSDDVNDLMGPTVGYDGITPSTCDVKGVATAHEWLVSGGGTQYHQAKASVTCP